jgi:hypothetical protein
VSAALRLDFDGPFTGPMMSRIYAVLRTVKIVPSWIRVDRTRRGYHVTVAVRQRIAPLGIVALQAAMGSDWRREAFNFSRARKWKQLDAFWRGRWNVLYETHDRGVSMRGGFSVAESLGYATVQTKRLPGGGFRMAPKPGMVVEGIRGPLVVRPGDRVALSLIARACAVSPTYFRRHAVKLGAERANDGKGTFAVTCDRAIELLVSYGALKSAPVSRASGTARDCVTSSRKGK